MTYLLAQADARRIPLPDGSVHCCATSPPYWNLRDYGVAGQIGLEPTPRAYVESLLAVFGEVKRVLRDDATLWVNIGDSFASSGTAGPMSGASALNGGKGINPKHDGVAFGRAPTPPGLKPKDLCGIPWMLAVALRDELGFYLRQEITWTKVSPMPESVTDRPTSATEKIFLFSKSERYFYDQDACRVKQKTAPHSPGYVNGSAYAAGHSQREQPNRVWGGESGRNLWNYWTLNSEPFPGAHFAVFPSEIPRRAIKLGTSERGVCPACGAPWVRVTERTGEQGAPSWSGAGRANGCPAGGGHIGRIGQWTSESKTLGWQPSCSCPVSDPIPPTVLDPFNGAGTSGVVCEALGRRYVGLDLSRPYLDMSRHRLERPHAVLPGRPERDSEPLPLFASLEAQ